MKYLISLAMLAVFTGCTDCELRDCHNKIGGYNTVDGLADKVVTLEERVAKLEKDKRKRDDDAEVKNFENACNELAKCMHSDKSFGNISCNNVVGGSLMEDVCFGRYRDDYDFTGPDNYVCTIGKNGHMYYSYNINEALTMCRSLKASGACGNKKCIKPDKSKENQKEREGGAK